MAQPAQAPLPDFNEVGESFNKAGESFRNIGTHMKNCVNLPGYNDGARIMELLQQVRGSIQDLSQQVGRRMDGLEQQLGRRMDGLEHRMDEMKTTMMASNNNSRARTQNSLVSSPTAPLQPLRNPRTNEEIPNFPATPEVLMGLQDRTVRELLELLDVGTVEPNTQQARKQRLRSEVGLISVAA